MKKLFLLVLVLVLLPVVSFADLPDISWLSFDELLLLKEQISLALWSSDEWQSVTVPRGVYQIGVDIPEGYWTMTPVGERTGLYEYCDLLDSTGHLVSRDAEVYLAIYVSTRRIGKSWEDRDAYHELSLDMQSGMYVILPCDTIFTPYSGKPDLGFK